MTLFICDVQDRLTLETESRSVAVTSRREGGRGSGCWWTQGPPLGMRKMLWNHTVGNVSHTALRVRFMSPNFTLFEMVEISCCANFTTGALTNDIVNVEGRRNRPAFAQQT